MELIQDENSKYGNKYASINWLIVKGTHKRTSKPLNKWYYNGIYMSPPKSETKEKSTSIEETSKSETIEKNKCPYKAVYMSSSKSKVEEKSSNTKKNSKIENG